MRYYKLREILSEASSYVAIVLGLIIMAEFAIILGQAIVEIAQK